MNLKHVSAIRRENQRPVLFRDNILDLKTSLLKDINLLKKEHFSVAIITKDDSESEKVYELLKNDVKDINILNSNTKNFNKKMVIIPSYIAKGLEFDSVIIYTEKENSYKQDEKYLYYVACTRAQHQLIIYNNHIDFFQ